MMKRAMRCALACGAILLPGCGKKEVVSPPEGTLAEIETAVKAPPEVVGHLGFAERVPRDADLFVVGFDFGNITDLLSGLFLEEETLLVGEGEDENELHEGEPGPMEEVKMYIGDEAFVFVGPGAGAQLQMVGIWCQYQE